MGRIEAFLQKSELEAQTTKAMLRPSDRFVKHSEAKVVCFQGYLEVKAVQDCLDLPCRWGEGVYQGLECPWVSSEIEAERSVEFALGL